MKVTYIYHSGFLVETDTSYYLFDYYRGKLPLLSSPKPVIVFSSHNHQDHYNPQVFSLLKDTGAIQITAILSDDIPLSDVPHDITAFSVSPDQNYDLPTGQHLTVLRSTDQGAAFLLQEKDGVIYHAGDLNDWVWEEESPAYNKAMTSKYRQEIDKLAGTHIHIAFLPLDPRQGQAYARGILYFLQKIHPDIAYPMHYWETPRIISQFRKEYPQFADITAQTEKETN